MGPITNPVLIGLVGPAGSGKSTAAAHLCERHHFVEDAFAGALKDMLEALFVNSNTDPTHLFEPALKTRPLTGINGLSARQLMQSLGDWGCALAPDFWVDQLAMRVGLHASSLAPVHDRIVISDVRFPNEAAWIHRLGGRLVRLHRDAAELRAHSQQHRSERENQGIATWAALQNHYGLPVLQRRLDELLAQGWPDLFTPHP